MSKYVRNSDIKTITPLTSFDVECLANLQPEMYAAIKDIPVTELYLVRGRYDDMTGVVSKASLLEGYTKL